MSVILRHLADLTMRILGLRTRTAPPESGERTDTGDDGGPKDEIVRRKIAELRERRENGLITIHEYERRKADLVGEPWVGVVGSEYVPDPDGGAGRIALEFEWNERFVEILRRNGYEGDTDEEVVDSWFAHVAALVVMEKDPSLLERRGLQPVRIQRTEHEDGRIVFR